jgi:hypothetical protein
VEIVVGQMGLKDLPSVKSIVIFPQRLDSAVTLAWLRSSPRSGIRGSYSQGHRLDGFGGLGS